MAEQEASNRGYWGRTILVWTILFYRRFLSGRGPLNGVRCTFENTESCSAFGLRVAREAGSLFEALREIRARLRRCHEASLYRRADGPGVLWGAFYDEPETRALESEIRWELESTRRVLLWNLKVLSRLRGDGWLGSSGAERRPEKALVLRSEGAIAKRSRLILGSRVIGASLFLALLCPWGFDHLWFFGGGALLLISLLVVTRARLAREAQRMESLSRALDFHFSK